MSRSSFNRGNANSLVLIALALVVIAGVVGGAVWYSTIKTPNASYLKEQEELFLRLTGLSQPVSNKLDAAFTDANGDLIADVPTNAAELIDPPTLVFSYVAVDDSAEFVDAFKDLMTYIGGKTGKPVEYLSVQNTVDQLRALRAGKLHVTGFNTGGVPIAVNVSGFVPTSLMAGAEGKGLYQSLIIVRSTSSIQSTKDLSGAVLTLTDPSSNSGYKAPLVMLKKDFNMLPGRDYAFRYSGSQDASIEGIASGEYEAAAVASDVLDRAVADGRIKKEQFRVIQKSADFPGAALGYAYNLKPELAAKISEAIKTFDWKGSSLQKHFSGEGKTQFINLNYSSEFSLVRLIDDQIGYSYTLPAEAPATQPESK